MTKDLWNGWLAEWRAMQALAIRRGWEVTPLRVWPRADAGDIASLEARFGGPVPAQLREVLTEFSAKVEFDWTIPLHLRPQERVTIPSSGGLVYRAIWDIDHIGEYAIGNFNGWKRQLADVDISEEPNRPEMWEKHFPFACLYNGDMLTIDVSDPNGPQPVRYFSHDLEGLHAKIIAPDFLSLVTVYSALGCAGGTHDDWFRFIGPVEGDRHYLSSTSPGALAWKAWLARDPNDVEPGDPPPAVVETNEADRALLVAARANSKPGVLAALAAGAKIDCVPNIDWLLDGKFENRPEEFETALNFAARHDNIEIMETLLKRGAALDTRRLALNSAIEYGSLVTVKWLIAQGARVNGWRHDRHKPLHVLIENRANVTPREAARRRQTWIDLNKSQAFVDWIVPKPLTRDDYFAMLDALLEAGAEPDAPWDNGLTMLMRCDPQTAKRLLEHGADVRARDHEGRTALHYQENPETIRLLVAHGAVVNDLPPPPANGEKSLRFTPLQTALLGQGYRPTPERIAVLLEQGADPKRRDSDGNNTLAYCRDVENFKRMQAYGLDPKERLQDGGTLLHILASFSSIRPTAPSEVAIFEHLLAIGLEINATDAKGQTILHRLAPRETTGPQEIELALRRGADKSIRDKDGKRAADLAPRSRKELRALLE